MKFFKDPAYLTLFLCALILIVLALVLNGTADGGDSPMHYMYSHWAFKYPENFFNQWAKPLYVMITAPIAQLGFSAVKVFNVCCWTLQLYFVIKIARYFNIKSTWLLPILALTAPMNLTHTLSALTEPLFAVWLAASIYFLIQRKTVLAVLLLSFLPFIRSEGLIIICPAIIYLLLDRKWKFLPLLLTGHVVIGLIGYPYHGDLWWVFTKMSYAVWYSIYGSGPWYYFIKNFPIFDGLAQSLLLVVGLGYGGVHLLLRGRWFRSGIHLDESWLIYGFFLSYFIAHSLYWWLGIFNSCGLLRVFVGIMPVILIITLRGIEVIRNYVNAERDKVKNVLFYAVLTMSLVISFILQNYWRKEIVYDSMQESFVAIKSYLTEKDPDYTNKTFYVHNASAIYQLGLNFFDKYLVRDIRTLLNGEPVAPGYVLYDDFTMSWDARITLDSLKRDKRLSYLGRFTGLTPMEGEVSTHLFEVTQLLPVADWSRDVLAVADTARWIIKDGRRAIFLTNGPNESSPWVDLHLGGFKGADSLYAILDLYSSVASEHLKFPGMLTVGATYQYAPLFWHGIDINAADVKPGWNQVTMSIPFPEKRYRDITYRLGLLNTNGDSLFVSNFNIVTHK